MIDYQACSSSVPLFVSLRELPLSPFVYSARGIPRDGLRHSLPLFAPQTGKALSQAKKKNMNKLDSIVIKKTYGLTDFQFMESHNAVIYTVMFKL